MARRDDGGLALLLAELVRAPWWVGVVVAVVVYIGLACLLPSVVGGGPVFGPAVEVAAGLAWLFAGLFLLPAALSGLRVWRGRRMLAATRTKDEIRALDWEEFEELVEAHYRRLGFSVRREGGSGPDGGVDVRIRRGGETYLVQCKQWRQRQVGVKVVRELLGVVAAEQAAGGIVVTAGSFTREAEAFAGRSGVVVELVDGDRLQGMISDPPGKWTTAEGGADSAMEEAFCPRCGSVLVLRTARRGPNRGSRFYGCSAFPRCRFTEPC